MTLDSMIVQTKQHSGLAGLDTARLKAIRNASLKACFAKFEETRYRKEFVARILGREYINDAASRTVNATWYTLESTEGGIVWITCGSNEAVDYSRIVPVALRKVRAILVIGQPDGLKSAFAGVVPAISQCQSMADALHRAYLYDAQDVKVVFSPACDDGTPTQALGEAFCNEVNEL